VNELSAMDSGDNVFASEMRGWPLGHALLIYLGLCDTRTYSEFFAERVGRG